MPRLWRIEKYLRGLKARPMFHFLFPWAIAETRKRYRRT